MKKELSKRELEYLKWRILGYKEKQIAEKMKVSTSRVKVCAFKIKYKLDTSSIAESVAIAFRLGILK